MLSGKKRDLENAWEEREEGGGGGDDFFMFREALAAVIVVELVCFSRYLSWFRDRDRAGWNSKFATSLEVLFDDVTAGTVVFGVVCFRWRFFFSAVSLHS